MFRIIAAFLATFSICPAAFSQQFSLSGKWATRLGVVRIFQKGNNVQAKLIWSNETCPFPKGTVLFEGVLLEDSLSGRWHYCLVGEGCRGDGWAPMLMLVAREGQVLSGAAHFPAGTCKIGGRGKGDALVARKLKPIDLSPSPAKPVPTGPVDEKGRPLVEQVPALRPEDYAERAGDWRAEMEKAAAQMEAGFFERARQGFLKAIEIDPTRPEAYNGVGVTYYARNDYQEALNWYKKALEVDASFPDAFYNMACVYALLGKKQLALRYLNIAALNGYTEISAMEQDPDLESLRGDPEYRKIVEQMKNKK